MNTVAAAINRMLEARLVVQTVVRIFPNEASALRLIGSLLIDIDEAWLSNDRKYIQYTEDTKTWFNA